MTEDNQTKQLVNKIFTMKGLPKVKNFAQEFSDGGKLTVKIFKNFSLSVLIFLFVCIIELFQKLFNILYEENINCRLIKSIKVEDKILNWNRINA